MDDIIGALFILAGFIFGIPIGIALLIFIIRRIFLSITGEARRVPVKDTLETSFGCVIFTIMAIAFIIWILSL